MKLTLPCMLLLLFLPALVFGAEPAAVPLALPEDGLPAADVAGWEDVEAGDGVAGLGGYLHPFLIVEEDYTDNLYRTDNDRQSDYRTVLVPGLWLATTPRPAQLQGTRTLLAMPGGLEIGRFVDADVPPVQGYLLYRAAIERYVRFSEEDRTNQRGEGLLQARSPRGFSLAVFDLYEHQDDPFAGGDATGRRLDRYASNLLQLIGIAPLGARTSLRGDYSRYRLLFDDTPNAFRERSDDRFSLRLSRRALAQHEPFILYEHVIVDYDQTVLPDSREDHLYGGLEWKVTSKSRGRIMLGYAWKEFDDGRDYGDAVGEVRLDHRFTPKSSVYLQGLRKGNEPDSETAAAALAHQLKGGIRYQFGPRLSLALDAGYLREKYRETAVVGTATGLRRDDYYSAALQFGYRFRPWLQVDAGYRYVCRDSSFATLSYRENAVFVKLTTVL